MIATLHSSLVTLHVACGFLALTALWVPLFSKKGGTLHVRVGKVYAAAMLVVVLTALIVSVMAFVDPVAIAPETTAGLAGDRLEGYVSRRRMFAVFLSFLALVTLSAGWQGLGALRHKKDPRAFRTPATLAVHGLAVAAGIAVLVFGLVRGAVLLIALSFLGPAIGMQGLRYVSRPAESPMAWWYAHMGGMIATAIAANTAFLVFGASRILPIDLGGTLGVFVWLAPTLVGTPAIWILERKYRGRFGEAKRPAGT